jgi:hypothetical protein
MPVRCNNSNGCKSSGFPIVVVQDSPHSLTTTDDAFA